MNIEMLFATNNAGKLNEVRKLAEPEGINVLSPQDINLDIDPDETGDSFESNARLKVEAFLGEVPKSMWVAGDDSGVMIDALNGEPNIHTRRWIGQRMTDNEIRDYAITKLKGVPKPKRTALFRSIVALGHGDEAVKFFQGEIRGEILETPNTEVEPIEGFPFRQIFYVPEADRMLGHFDDVPGFLTHRQRAFKKVFEYILKTG